MKYTCEEIKNKVNAVYDEVIALRRHLHMHPELSEQEYETIDSFLFRWSLFIKFLSTLYIAKALLSSKKENKEKNHFLLVFSKRNPFFIKGCF